MSGRILVVDDIATNRVILRSKLAASYYEVVQAENGQEALDKALSCQPDLILLDIIMPDINGFEVCRKLKSDPRTQAIPVVIITALQDPLDRLKGLEAGADDFLTKPINDLALFSRLRNLLRSKFMLDELGLREKTSADLGLSDSVLTRGDIPNPPAKVALVATTPRMAADWQDILATRPDISPSICSGEKTAMALEGDNMPDVFLIHARLGAFGDGLRLVSYLRSRPKSRHAAIVLVVPDEDQNRAAKGLDLGANDYVFDPVLPAELLARINGQIRRKRISDRLRNSVTDGLRLAVTDPLTGLYNRRYARQHLGKITDRARETGKGFALMLLDIDNFKAVNDTYGHATGDLVLKEFARRMLENLRGVDLISRLGGEEFLVAMPDTTKEQALVASERLRRVIEETPFEAAQSGRSLPVTVSVGVTFGNPNSPDVDCLIGEADKALYASKSDGRNMVSVFSPAA
jgi:two-component system cell cycle response regulator